MKQKNTLRVVAVFAAGLLATAGGCQSEKDRSEAADALARDQAARELDAEMVTGVRDAAVKNGIIAQRTIFPYHFVPDAATLNELGRRDLAVLAEHFQAAADGAALNIRRGGVVDALYDARVRAVTDELGRSGIPDGKLRIADALLGGDGMASDRVTIVLERDRDTKPYYGGDSKSGAGEVKQKSGGEKPDGGKSQ